MAPNIASLIQATIDATFSAAAKTLKAPPENKSSCPLTGPWNGILRAAWKMK
jgi:hypothetical protein